jgi:hypothetical protein
MQELVDMTELTISFPVRMSIHLLVMGSVARKIVGLSKILKQVDSPGSETRENDGPVDHHKLGCT